MNEKRTRNTHTHTHTTHNTKHTAQHTHTRTITRKLGWEVKSLERIRESSIIESYYCISDRSDVCFRWEKADWRTRYVALTDYPPALTYRVFLIIIILWSNIGLLMIHCCGREVRWHLCRVLCSSNERTTCVLFFFVWRQFLNATALASALQVSSTIIA